MCGIVGIVRKERNITEESKLKTMMNLLQHRDPDSSGIYIDERVHLGSTRLKILDLSDRANQPFKNENYVLVFNGEIFNYQQLKEELKSKYEFKTTSDTEVLFYALIEWGDKALSKIDGQFAFIFYNKTN